MVKLSHLTFMVTVLKCIFVTKDSETQRMRLSNLKPIAGVGYFAEPAKYHTAGTASQLADASSALLVMSREKAQELGLTPLAKVVSSCLVGSDPALMLTGPIPATQELLADTGLSTDDIDIFEINEAFAAVVLAWAKEIGIEIDERVNPNGGAIAIGHALGSTGPLLITNLFMNFTDPAEKEVD